MNNIIINKIKDLVLDLYEIKITDKHCIVIINEFKEWSGKIDTIGLDELGDMISEKFTGMKIPRFGDSKEYKSKFQQKISNTKEQFKWFLYEN